MVGSAQVSGDVFYTEANPRLGWSSWTSPQSLADKLAHPGDGVNGSAAAASGGPAGGPGSPGGGKQERSAPPAKAVLQVGDRVLFKFAESPDLVNALVVRCRQDPDNGERCYDVQDEVRGGFV